MEKEMRYQPEDLPRLKLPPPSENCLFVGSGDSYAASLAARYFSGSHALCCYPTDIILNPSITKGRNIYVVSISGKTKANVLAAMAANKYCIQTTAITACPTSKLAKVCNNTMELRYRNTGVTTAGTISFTSSMLTCISLAGKEVNMPSHIGRIFGQAESQASTATDKIIGTRGSYFVLGNGFLQSIALYGALKFNEVLGNQAISYPVEEFCHAPLFSIKKSDHPIIMATDDGGKNLDKSLGHEGFSSICINFNYVTGIDVLLYSTFFIQLLVLKLARKRRLNDCYFLQNKRLLKISSDSIYD
jgi:glutamine---fructose-6-phosphate transaminase (isomerizing)